tara:strand:- start:30 stop:1274 length:1245 start_codon:yes stop_codon:yes gene_type:complete
MIVNKPFHLSINFLFLFISFLIITKFFFSSILGNIFSLANALFLVFSLITLIFYIIKIKKFNFEISYLICLSIFVPIFSSLVAYINFDQPIIYGILALRQWFMIGFLVYLYESILSRKFEIELIEKVFLGLAFFSLIFNSFIFFTSNASEFTEGTSTFYSETKGLRVRYPFTFITFGIIYYFIKINQSLNWKNFLIFLTFLLYSIFIIKSRMYFLILFFILLLIVFNMSNKLAIVKKIVFSIVLLFFIYAGAIVLNPEFISSFFQLYNEMFVVLSGDLSSDASSNARIFQLFKVFNFFSTNPSAIFYGSGTLSSQWKDGFEGFFGYLYPTDIGLLGGIFQYGILGLIFMWLIPIKLIYKKINYLNERSIFESSLKYFFLFTVLRGIYNGNSFFRIDEYLISFIIILAISKFNLK